MNSFVRFPTLADAAEHMCVGDRQQMDYSKLKSTVTSLRAFKDGRRWSIESIKRDGQTTFYLVRKA